MPCDPTSTDKNAEKIEPMPSLSDVRRLVTEHCILPLGIIYVYPSIYLSIYLFNSNYSSLGFLCEVFNLVAKVPFQSYFCAFSV